jgi:hypothetical protein
VAQNRVALSSDFDTTIAAGERNRDGSENADQSRQPSLKPLVASRAGGWAFSCEDAAAHPSAYFSPWIVFALSCRLLRNEADMPTTSCEAGFADEDGSLEQARRDVPGAEPSRRCRTVRFGMHRPSRPISSCGACRAIASSIGLPDQARHPEEVKYLKASTAAPPMAKPKTSCTISLLEKTVACHAFPTRDLPAATVRVAAYIMRSSLLCMTSARAGGRSKNRSSPHRRPVLWDREASPFHDDRSAYCNPLVPSPFRRTTRARISSEITYSASWVTGSRSGQKISCDVEADRRSGKDSATNLRA